MAGHTTVEPGQTAADLRRELALRTAERDEALAQLTATAEVLRVINSSLGDLAPVFDAMLEKAMRLCEAPAGFLLRYEGGKYFLAAGRGLSEEFARCLAEMEDWQGPDTGTTRVLAGEPYAHVVDMKNTEAYRLRSPIRRDVVDIAGMGTGLAVPLRKDDAVIGTFHLGRYEIRPFSDKQIALARTFADQ